MEWDLVWLFGVVIGVSRRSVGGDADDQCGVPNNGTSLESSSSRSDNRSGLPTPTLALLRERPIQESLDNKALEVISGCVAAANGVGASLKVCTSEDSDVVNGVDTSLRLSTPNCLYSHQKRVDELIKKMGLGLMGKKMEDLQSGMQDWDKGPIHNPQPLKWLHGAGPSFTQQRVIQEFQNSGVDNASRNRKLQKRRQRDDHDDTSYKRGGKSFKRGHANDSQVQVDDDQIPFMEEFPVGLLAAVRSNDGIGQPVFLYAKRLEESDVKQGQNRLFVTRTKRLMEFLAKEEWNCVADHKGGLNVRTVDAQGQVYTLHLAIWPSLNMLVVNVDWKKLVLANKDAQKGGVVQLWGFRQPDGKPCFAVNFRAAPEAAAQAMVQD